MAEIADRLANLLMLIIGSAHSSKIRVFMLALALIYRLILKYIKAVGFIGYAYYQ